MDDADQFMNKKLPPKQTEEFIRSQPLAKNPQMLNELHWDSDALKRFDELKNHLTSLTRLWK